MRAVRISTVISLLLLPGLLQAQEGPPIERVVVFADRAEVTRVGTARCTQGKGDVAFTGLPTSLDERTLRAEAAGRAEAIGLTRRTVALEEHRDARVAELDKQIEALSDELATLGQQETLLADRSGRLEAYRSYTGTLLGEQARDPKANPAVWATSLDTFARERRALATEQAGLAVKRRGLQRKREVLQRRLSKLDPEQEAEALQVVVAVDCKGGATSKVSLSYVVPGATWHPEYDLRFLPRGQAKAGPGRAELTVAAVVQQASGEDWSNVTLQLSTAKPKLGAEAPYPARLVVKGHQAGKKKVLVDTMERREKLDGPADARNQGPEGAELEDRGQSFLLTLPGRVTVRADGRPYWMPVDTVSTAAESRLVTLPKLSPYVYQVVTLKNPAAYPLLAGRVHAHRSGSYIGDSQLEYKAPGEPMEVSLGIDEEIRVERKARHEGDRSAGLLSSTKHIDRSWRFRLTSTASTGARVEVRENIPVSKTEEVRIEIVKDRTTSGYALDGHRGFITWTVDVPAGKEKAVDLGWSIHLPESWGVRIR